MMAIPDFEKVWRGRRGMRAGIRACERAQCVVSTLTLVYSGIDALAALTRNSVEERATSKEFKNWVHAYLILELQVALTAEDIWGARCGVVHSNSPTSDLSKKGQAKLIIYKWRDGHRPDDPVLAARAEGAAVIEIEALIEGLDRAVNRFECDIDINKQLRQLVEQNIADLLCYEPWRPVAITVAA